MTTVFISHANQDKEAVVSLCAALQERGVDTWASVKDIKSGDDWDKAIEKALETASHMIVMVSQASVAADYVRTEVEWALDNAKTVIPLLIEQVELPSRWQTLQYVDLTTTAENREIAWASFIDNLPKNTRYLVLSLLDAEAPIEQVRELLWKNPQIISHSTISQSDISKLSEAQSGSQVSDRDDGPSYARRFEREDTLDFVERRNLIDVLSRVDFFDAQPVTIFRYKLVYLLSTAPPFDPHGIQSDELKRSLEDAEKAIATPSFITRAAFPPEMGAEMIVTIVAGRRHHYQGGVMEQRLALERQWASSEWRNKIGSRLRKNLNARVTGKISFRSQLELISYDYLLEQI